MCELAENLGMTLQDLGARASNFEVCVTWPAYYAEKARLAEIEAEKQAQQRGAR